MGKSGADYAVATPGVVWGEDGLAKSGSSLEVWACRVIGYTRSLNDHHPVTLTVMTRTDSTGGQIATGGAQEQGASWRRRGVTNRLQWQDSRRADYVRALTDALEVRGCWMG